MTRFVTLLVCALVLSCASPTTFELVRDQATYGSARVIGLRQVAPLNMHLGIWRDVNECVSGEAPVPPEGFFWAVADTIITPDGYLAYGVTAFLPRLGAVGIILERPYWAFAPTISHEAVHAITQNPTHEGAEWTCVMPSPVDLPLRPYAGA